MPVSRPILLALLAASLAGCTGYSAKSNFTLPSITPFSTSSDTTSPADGKATVLFTSSIEGLACAEKHMVLAVAEGGGFRTIRQERVDSDFDGGAGAAVVDLDPGTYHIVDVACRSGANVVHAGTNPAPDAVPWEAEHWTRSLASFALAPGDVLDAGELVLTPKRVDGFGAGIDGRKVELTVRPSAEKALAEIIRSRPELAPRLHTSWMVVAEGTGPLLAKCHLVSPNRPMPKDGSSKMPDVIAEHPLAKPLVDSIGWATTDSHSCTHDAGGGKSPLGSVSAPQ